MGPAPIKTVASVEPVATARSRGTQERVAKSRKSRRLKGSDEGTANDLARLIHKLELRQVELETRNQELRRLKIALEESRSRYADLYDSAPAAYLTLTRDGTIAELNFAATALLAVERGEVLGERFASFVTTGDRGRWQQMFRELMEQNKRQVGEFVLNCANGATTLARLDCRRITSNGGAPLAHLTLTDTTRREPIKCECPVMFDVIPALLCMASPDGRFLNLNAEWKKVLGYSKEELLEIGYASLIHPDDVTPTMDEVARQLRGHATANFINRYRHKNGSYRLLEWQATPALDGVLYATARDITERAQQERDLARSKDLLQTILDNIPIAVCSINPGGKVDWVNTHWERVFGWSREEAISRDNAADLYPDPETRAGVTRFAMEGSGLWKDFRTRTKDGRTIDTSWANVLCRDGTSIGIGQDITERKQLMRTVQESEERYRLLFERSLDAVLLTVPDGTVLQANPAACRMFGRSEEEIRQGGRKSLVDESDPQFAVAVEQRNRTGQFIGELTFLRKDGRTFPGELSSAVFKNEHGEVRTSMLIRDVSERKRMEQRMRLFSQEILAAREEERKLVSSVLHNDVGSMAVGISANLDAIEGDLRLGKAGDALKSIKRTRTLFRESVTRLKTLAVQIRPPELDLLGLAAALRQHFVRITKNNGIRIQFRETMKRRRVAGETATMLFRIAQEALTNAITHGQAKRVDIQLNASKEKISLIVHDNGMGFDRSAIREQDISHMGLRVMQEMTTFAGGAFSIDSVPGKGTTLRVDLQRATSVRVPRKAPPLVDAVPRRKATSSARQGSRARKARGV